MAERDPFLVPELIDTTSPETTHKITIRIILEDLVAPDFLATDYCFDANDSIEDNLKALVDHTNIDSRQAKYLFFKSRLGTPLDSSKPLVDQRVSNFDIIRLASSKTSMNTLRENWAWLLIGGLAAIVALSLAIYLCVFLQRKGVSNDRNYGIVIDAGSVHSTINVYSWPLHKVNGTGLVRSEYVCESDNEQGISSFDSDPEGVRSYVIDSPCFTSALNQMPSELLEKTPVFLGATAGMRVLNDTYPDKAAAIMGNISIALDSVGLRKTRPNAAILSGSDEGVLGWISANYLSDVFGTNKSEKKPSSPFGALDWGGASSQLTFNLNNSQTRNLKTKDINLFGSKFNLFTHSHLCYGQAEAMRRYFVDLIYQNFISSNGDLVRTLKSPCQPRSHSKSDWYTVPARDLFFSPCTKYRNEKFQKIVSSLSPDTEFTFVGSSNLTGCTQEVIKSFDLDSCRQTYSEPHCFDAKSIIKPPQEMKFLAFSTYWYLVSFLSLPVEKLNQSMFEAKIHKLCQSTLLGVKSQLTVSTTEPSHNICFRAIFMNKLLEEYGLWSNSIKFVNTINSADVSWTLGYMLEQTNNLMSVEVLNVGQNKAIFVVSVAMLFLLAILFTTIYTLLFRAVRSSKSRSFILYVDEWSKKLAAKAVSTNSPLA